MKRYLALLFGLVTAYSSAGDLKAPIGLPSAAVLPKGVRNLTYKGVLTGATSKYNNEGSSDPLADPFFKDISFQNVIDGKDREEFPTVDQASIQQILQAIGAKESDIVATTRGQVDVVATAHVPIIAFGATDRLTFAMAVPVVRSSTNVQTAVNHTNPQAILDFCGELANRGVSTKAQECKDKLSDPIPNKLKDYGYAPLKSENKSQLGDIKLVAKYLTLKTKRQQLALQAEVTLATGKRADINKAVDIPSGDEQTDLGASIIYNLNVYGPFSVISQIGYTRQMPDTVAMRIPEKGDSKLSRDTDFQTERKLGDSYLGHAGLVLNQHGFTFGLGYSFQYKHADKYGGSKFSRERYQFLEKKTEQRMHAVQAQASYDTIALFRQKKFPVPLRVGVNFSRVVSGKNVVSDPLVALEFSMFF